MRNGRAHDEKKEKVKGKRGPKFKQLDEAEIFKLAKLWCTNEEIASCMGVSADTIERNYAGIVKKGKEEARASLRRMQWAAAQEGNVTMLIFLGKNELGQRDIPKEIPVSIEKQDKFDAVMGQLSALISARKKDDKSISKEQ